MADDINDVLETVKRVVAGVLEVALGVLSVLRVLALAHVAPSPIIDCGQELARGDTSAHYADDDGT
jgi:hypothetical protein